MHSRRRRHLDDPPASLGKDLNGNSGTPAEVLARTMAFLASHPCLALALAVVATAAVLAGKVTAAEPCGTMGP